MDRTESTTPDEDAGARHEPELDSGLDTGHPAWIRIVTLVVLAVFVLATLVAALL